MGNKKHSNVIIPHNTGSAEYVCSMCPVGELHFYYCYFPSQFYHIIYAYLGLHFLKCPVFLRIWHVFWNYTLMSQMLVVLPVLLDLNSQFKFICNLHNLKFVLDLFVRHWNCADFSAYWNYSERMYKRSRQGRMRQR